MSLAGARGLILLSRSSCDWLAAMVADRVDEREFYARVTGEKYAGEYGLQRSATQRGIRFEKRLYANDGAELRRILSALCGVAPEQMKVQNFAAAHVTEIVQARRDNLAAMRRILTRLRDGMPVPHLIIQPQLLLPVGEHDARYISPDFMLLVGAGRDRRYICGEIKSHILQEGMAAPPDRQRARLQAAVETMALQAELDRLGTGGSAVDQANRAIFVYASPYGLSPAPPVVEQLEAEVHEIRRATLRLTDVLSRLRQLREGQDVPLQRLLPQLTPHYVESCPSICLLADTCKQRITGRGQALGDNAASMLGYEADLTRLSSLLDNGVPAEECSGAELDFIEQMRSLLPCVDAGPAGPVSGRGD
ncbi:MAG: hypothetical protein ABI670_11850 [Chloroflexota bacterium]